MEGKMDKMIKTYVNSTAEIIGDRTSDEIKYDEEVVAALNQGHTIEEALGNAGIKYPNEALKSNDSNIDDIKAHYEYLQEHNRIMTMLKRRG